MRCLALRAAGVAFVAFMALAGPTAQQAEATPLDLTPEQQRFESIVAGQQGTAFRVWGYWGKFSGPRSGDYRATCFRLTNARWNGNPQKKKNSDNRFLCTLVLSFRALDTPSSQPNGGTLVAQGLARPRPQDDGLFARASARRLPITGGTGPFAAAQGYIDLQQGNIAIEY